MVKEYPYIQLVLPIKITPQIFEDRLDVDAPIDSIPIITFYDKIY